MRKQPFIFRILRWILYTIIFSSGVMFGHYKPFPFLYLSRIKHTISPTNYKIEIFEDFSRKNLIQCPENSINILVFGQSNSANHISGMIPFDHNINLANFYNGKCVSIEDPLLGASGTYGSIWALFAQKHFQKYQKPLIVLSHGVLGASSEDWLPDNTESNYYKRMIGNALNLKRDIQYVIFHQGESDAELGTGFEEYKSNINKLFDSLQGSLSGEQTFLIFGVSRCNVLLDGNPEFINLQKQIAEERSDTKFVFSTDTLDSHYRYDKCHFNHRGANEIATQLLDFVKP